MRAPVLPAPAATGQPVEVRLTGDDRAVRTAVAALQAAAACSPASYRPSRYGDGTRAYLTLIVPTTTEAGA